MSAVSPAQAPFSDGVVSKSCSMWPLYIEITDKPKGIILKGGVFPKSAKDCTYESLRLQVTWRTQGL